VQVSDGSRLFAGLHDTEEAAALAFDVAALRLRGPTAQLNFEHRRAASLLEAIATSAVAAAATNDNVHATGGDGTTVDTDGTQGDFTSSVQGTVDDDGDQDAFMVTAEEATPQYSAAK
jgi:hypothetical protein